MNAEEKHARASDFAWYHTIDLGDGVVTDGLYDHRPILHHYGIPADLTGKRVLDVGPAHGFFAFELEARGADPVVTVELPNWSDHDASPVLKQRFATESFDATHESYLHGALSFAIEARGSRVEQRFANVYDLTREAMGAYDLVFCASMLLHVTDPLRALFAIRSVTRGSAIIATTISRHRFGRRPSAVFIGEPQGQVFWLPTMATLERWCLAAGFARCEQGKPFRIRSRDGKFADLTGVVRAWT